MKTFSEIALECMERHSQLKQKLPNHRTLIQPKHERLEQEMLDRSRPVNNAKEQALLKQLWHQVAGN